MHIYFTYVHITYLTQKVFVEPKKDSESEKLEETGAVGALIELQVRLSPRGLRSCSAGAQPGPWNEAGMPVRSEPGTTLLRIGR